MRNNKEYSVIMFDFGGVVAEEGFVEGMKEIGRKYGLDPKFVLDIATDILYESGYICGRAPEAVFWAAFKKRFNLNEIPDEDLRSEVLKRFVLRDWMLDLIQRLRGNGFKVALLTDQTNWVEEVNEKTPFYDKFDHVFNSYRLGKCKRDGSIFDEVLKVLRVNPERIIFVDDKDENISLAERLGIKGILYVDKDSFLRRFYSYLPKLKGQDDMLEMSLRKEDGSNE